MISAIFWDFRNPYPPCNCPIYATYQHCHHVLATHFPSPSADIMCEGPLTSIRCLKRHSDGGHVGVGITSCFASVSFRDEMELEGRRRALCAAMRHSSQCRFNNCDKIDGACGKTKRIIKASADTLCESHATWGKHFLAARPIRTLHLEGKFCKKVSSLHEH